ncbi:hypothetical protein KIPB_005972 [Kipferlia bialata]|uniref:Uncharacterized protein n=1 Tax=Kipferlia bialata TaxID=797122 RepID=A0A9K3GJG8_9EUKA|nr:hypothetical protein KIPB_005972 [Kipferlia bialata]|eukprot:g5972.t1
MPMASVIIDTLQCSLVPLVPEFTLYLDDLATVLTHHLEGGEEEAAVDAVCGMIEGYGNDEDTVTCVRTVSGAERDRYIRREVTKATSTQMDSVYEALLTLRHEHTSIAAVLRGWLSANEYNTLAAALGDHVAETLNDSEYDDDVVCRALEMCPRGRKEERELSALQQAWMDRVSQPLDAHTLAVYREQFPWWAPVDTCLEGQSNEPLDAHTLAVYRGQFPWWGPVDTCLEGHTNELCISMSHPDDISPEGELSLAHALSNMPMLTKLSLTRQSWGCRSQLGLGYLSMSLRHLPQLQQLAVTGFDVDETMVRHLSRALCHVPNLIELDLGMHDLGYDGALFLADALHNIPHLQKLDLSTYDAGVYDGASAIARGLVHTPHLTELRVTLGEIIDHKCITDLAQALALLPDLTVLDLSASDLGDEGARLVAEALHYLPRLAELDLCETFISDEGVNHLAIALKDVPQLTKLMLRQNQISRRGAKRLASAIVDHPCLEVLDLYGNKVSEWQLKELNLAGNTRSHTQSETASVLEGERESGRVSLWGRLRNWFGQ